MVEPTPEVADVDVHPTPSRSIEAVSQVELRQRVLARGIGPREGQLSGPKLVAMKELQPIGKGLLINPIHPHAGREATGHLGEGLGLVLVKPYAKYRVRDDGCKSDRADGLFPAHH